MPDRRRPTIAETNNALTFIQQALEDLRQFTEPTNTDCSVSPEVRQAAKQFLDTWVETPLIQARAVLLRSGCGSAFLCEKAAEEICRYSARHLAHAVPAVTVLDCGPVGKVPACQRCADFYASQA